jgi:hypothetical protein
MHVSGPSLTVALVDAPRYEQPTHQATGLAKSVNCVSLRRTVYFGAPRNLNHASICRGDSAV